MPPFSALSGEALLQILQLDVNTKMSVRSLCLLNQLTMGGGILLVHKRKYLNATMWSGLTLNDLPF